MSTKHAQGISRRSFLAGTALASTGAVLGLAGCAPKENKGAEEANAETGSTSSDWLGSEPTVQESDIVETIDTEFLRERTYWSKLCLIQMALPGTEGEAVLVDPIEGGDALSLAPLYDLFRHEATVKVFHAARQDLLRALLRQPAQLSLHLVACYRVAIALQRTAQHRTVGAIGGHLGQHAQQHQARVFDQQVFVAHLRFSFSRNSWIKSRVCPLPFNSPDKAEKSSHTLSSLE